MSRPLVSCVIPVFNGERFIAETIDSVLGQTAGAPEVIVVDDGSTDGTPDVLRGFGERIHVVRQENHGPAPARNRGIEIATGAFVSFVDADDLWIERKLEIQLKRFEEDPALSVSFGWIRNFRDGRPPDEDDPELPPVPAYSSVTMLARREVLDRVGLFDESLVHGCDRDWILRANEQGVAMEMSPVVLCFRRLHAENRSARMAATSRREYVRILKASLDRRRRTGGEVKPYDLGASKPGTAGDDDDRR